MEEELKCSLCKQLFSNPVLLPCYHTLCLNCAVQLQQAVQQQPLSNVNGQPHSHSHSANFHGHSHHILVTTATVHHTSSHSDSSASSGTGETSSSEDSSDKVSILSETDSGVVVYSSRPNSYVGTPNIHGLLFPPIQSTVFCLSCPVCHKMVYFDEHGAHNLPKFRVMQNIVDKYVETRNLGTKCQLCEKNPRNATVMCEQCEIFYCDKCRENCHPARGPLAKHALVGPQQGKACLKLRAGPLEYKCPDHPAESLSMYCMLCKFPVCMGCLQERKHFDHDVQPIQTMSKAQKVNFSQFNTNYL
ncbi:unnamed protein product [Allacma fusca]|uniref:B box-type domain-containing protein n=1 Tax=Allacma fusca TaxID=39272 RepID=A0A8J2L187_9HEXA|nr:unnamed protein product [Allacma fusca]